MNFSNPYSSFKLAADRQWLPRFWCVYLFDRLDYTVLSSMRYHTVFYGSSLPRAAVIPTDPVQNELLGSTMYLISLRADPVPSWNYPAFSSARFAFHFLRYQFLPLWAENSFSSAEEENLSSVSFLVSILEPRTEALPRLTVQVVQLFAYHYHSWKLVLLNWFLKS